MTLETIDLRRAGTALLVVLIHGLLIAALLRATIEKPETAPPAREFILRFAQSTTPKSVKPEEPLPPVPLLAPPAPSSAAPGAGKGLAPSPGTNTGSLKGLYFFLYECTPENFPNLTENERARCVSASLAPVPNDTNSLRNQPSRAKEEPHWQRALARKKNPALLPCMSPQGFSPLGTAMCLGKAAAKGSFGDLDEAPGYGDDPPVATHGPASGDPQVPPMSRVPTSAVPVGNGPPP